MKRGTRIGPFRIIRTLGSGGMGEVCLATDLESCRHVALKMLHPQGIADERISLAFRKEAALGRALSHPNLVAFLDADLDADFPWIAFEYVVGSSLREVLRRNGPLSPSDATGILLDVTLGLAAAHQKGVLHRDLKPDNVLITPRGTVKLIDFGAAHLDPLPEDQTMPMSTSPGEAHNFAGTWIYASPEQLQGKDLDETSDLYSLSLVLYELLTGTLLIEPGTPGFIMVQHSRLEKRLPNLFDAFPKVPPVLAELVVSMLAFHPSRRRYRSAVDLAAALQDVVERAGWQDKVQSSERHLARLELAETDYWRAQNLMATGHVDEALILFHSLLDLPAQISELYRLQIRDDLLRLLPSFSLCHDGATEACAEDLATLTQVALLGKKVKDTSLLLLIERRFASIASKLKNHSERLQHCSRMLSLVPRSVVIGSLCLSTAQKCGNKLMERAIRLPLAQICLEGGSYRRALLLALQAMKISFSHDKASALLQELLQIRKDRKQVHQTFENVLSTLSVAGEIGQACNVCLRRLGEFPEDRKTWERFGRLLEQRGKIKEAANAFHRSAILAFATNDLPTARALFARTLQLQPDHNESTAFLIEILFAQKDLPDGLNSYRQLRLAVLCREKVVDAAKAALHRELSTTIADLPLLDALIPVAMAVNNTDMLEELQMQRGLLMLRAQQLDEAKEAFLNALGISCRPLKLLGTLLATRDIRQIFSPLELLRMRSDFIKNGALTSSQKSNASKQDTLPGKRHQTNLRQTMERESLIK